MIPPKDDAARGRTPWVTVALGAVNLAAFGWQVMAVGLERSIRRGGAIPFEVLTFQDIDWRAIVPPPLTVLTSMFLHGGTAHLTVNLLTLWAAGTRVERALDPARFAVLYLVSGVVGALAQTLAAAASGDVYVSMVGASGGIAGVLAAFLLLLPRARVLHAPAGVLILVWLAAQVLAVVFGGDPGVAFVAHVAGFVAGYLLVRIWVR